MQPVPRPVIGAGRHPLRPLAALAAAALVVIALVVVAVAARERWNATEDWRARLGAVAADRKRALDQWVSGGLADAALVASYPTTRYAVERRLGGPLPFPVERGTEAHLSELLGRVTEVHGYSDAYVLGRRARWWRARRVRPRSGRRVRKRPDGAGRRRPGTPPSIAMTTARSPWPSWPRCRCPHAPAKSRGARPSWRSRPRNGSSRCSRILPFPAEPPRR